MSWRTSCLLVAQFSVRFLYCRTCWWRQPVSSFMRCAHQGGPVPQLARDSRVENRRRASVRWCDKYIVTPNACTRCVNICSWFRLFPSPFCCRRRPVIGLGISIHKHAYGKYKSWAAAESNQVARGWMWISPHRIGVRRHWVFGKGWVEIIRMDSNNWFANSNVQQIIIRCLIMAEKNKKCWISFWYWAKQKCCCWKTLRINIC